MPKGFTELEKDRIIALLKEEGQKLFVQYGIKKVTVEDLAKAAHIAKGSFYIFYKTKEELYMDIVEDVQSDLLSGFEQLLNKKEKNSKKLVLSVLDNLLEKMDRYPILLQTESETIEALYRKLPEQRLKKHFEMDVSGIEIFIKHGIKFNCTPPVAAKVLQQAFIAGMKMDPMDTDRKEVLSILIQGAVEKIVRDDE